MKHDAIVGQGYTWPDWMISNPALTNNSIPILERVELPESWIPADSRVEIDAKITAGKFCPHQFLSIRQQDWIYD